MNFVVAGKNRIAVQVAELCCKIPSINLKVCPVESDVCVDGWQPSLRRKGRELGVDVVTLQEAERTENCCFLSLEYDKIINPKRFKAEYIFNLHFSLLPAYRGCLTAFWPIYFGEKRTGVTLHEIDQGIDTGPIVDWEIVEITNKTRARSLYEELQDAGFKCIQRNLNAIIEGSVSKKHQEASGASYFSRKEFGKLDSCINFKKTAHQVLRQVHSFYFPEFQVADFKGKGVAYCEVLNCRSTVKPGTIIDTGDGGSRVSTLDYDVLLQYI